MDKILTWIAKQRVVKHSNKVTEVSYQHPCDSEATLPILPPTQPAASLKVRWHSSRKHSFRPDQVECLPYYKGVVGGEQCGFFVVSGTLRMGSFNRRFLRGKIPTLA